MVRFKIALRRWRREGNEEGKMKKREAFLGRGRAGRGKREVSEQQAKLRMKRKLRNGRKGKEKGKECVVRKARGVEVKGC